MLSDSKWFTYEFVEQAHHHLRSIRVAARIPCRCGCFSAAGSLSWGRRADCLPGVMRSHPSHEEVGGYESGRIFVTNATRVVSFSGGRRLAPRVASGRDPRPRFGERTGHASSYVCESQNWARRWIDCSLHLFVGLVAVR